MILRIGLFSLLGFVLFVIAINFNLFSREKKEEINYSSILTIQDRHDKNNLQYAFDRVLEKKENDKLIDTTTVAAPANEEVTIPYMAKVGNVFEKPQNVEVFVPGEEENKLLKYFQTKEELSSTNGQVYISRLIRAVSKDNYKEEMGEKVFERLGHVFFQSPSSVDLSNEGPDGPMLVSYNKQTGFLGIVTGRFSMELANNQAHSSYDNSDEMIERVNYLLGKYDMILEYINTPIGFFQARSSYQVDYQTLLSKLSQESTLKSVQLEIIENTPSAR